MNILLTGAASALGQALTAGLKDKHQLRLSDRTALATDLEFVQSDLGHEEETDQLVTGINTIVHLPNPPLVLNAYPHQLSGGQQQRIVIAMALMAAILLYMGAGQISALQQFIVLTAIPVSLVLLPSLWTGPQAALAMARAQGITSQKASATGEA